MYVSKCIELAFDVLLTSLQMYLQKAAPYLSDWRYLLALTLVLSAGMIGLLFCLGVGGGTAPPQDENQAEDADEKTSETAGTKSDAAKKKD